MQGKLLTKTILIVALIAWAVYALFPTYQLWTMNPEIRQARAEEGTLEKLQGQAINLGLDLRDALLNLANRVNSLDLQLFVTAILLQRETGGNLTEILENISYTIRERFKLIGQIRTYTAQGRMSGWILGLLPIIFVLVISILNPAYLTPLFKDPLGHKLIFASATLQIVGFYFIRKIVQIKYQ